MSDNALAFIVARANPINLTKKRIRYIMQYIIYCYKLQLINETVYSKSKRSSKQKFEDYLKTRFVDDYLRKNKDYFKSINSCIEEISFGKEQTEIYTNDTDIEQEDRIDICIRELGLQKAWASNNIEEIYLAVECKRVVFRSDAKKYVLDIQKFADRKHIEFRLPFEGMIAFIENRRLNHITMSEKVTEILKETSTISTTQYLLPTALDLDFVGSYTSHHTKNFNNSLFSIYHLFLDYSTIVSD